MGIIDYKLVWQNLDAAIEQQLIDFWLAEGAMEEEKEARARLPYVAAIATDEEGLVGVASMQPAHSERLKRQMYFFRTFVGAEARGKGVATQLIQTVLTQPLPAVATQIALAWLCWCIIVLSLCVRTQRFGRKQSSSISVKTHKVRLCACAISTMPQSFSA